MRAQVVARLAAIVAFLAAAACGDGKAAGVSIADTTIVGLPAAAAAIHDADQDVYFVSGVVAGGAPYGAGYIARVGVDGQVTQRWIAGGDGCVLSDPKGMAIVGDELWVADRDTVRCFDRRRGKPMGAIAIPGAVGLVDVSAAPDMSAARGSVWVADGAGDKAGIFVIDVSRQVRRLELRGELQPATALVAQAHGVYLVTAGGEFALVDENGQVERLSRTPQSGLRGLGRVAAGRWLASSAAGRCLYSFDMRGGAPEPLALPPMDEPGDFGFDDSRQLLLVPSATSGQLAVRRLPPPR